jgi:hypothetical protein
VKAHHDRTNDPIDIGDVKAHGTQLYIATHAGWSCWMGAFVQPGFILGYPVEHWAFIASIKLQDCSVTTKPILHLLPCSGFGAVLAIWVAKFNVWKRMGITPDTPVEMIHALGVWDRSDHKTQAWHQFHQLILMCTEPNSRTVPYSTQEKGLLTWQ